MTDSDLDMLSNCADDKELITLLKNVIHRINFFSNFYKKLEKNYELPQIYDWFLYINLTNLYKFGDAFKINCELNEYNPFYIWSDYFNGMKHLDVERELARNEFEFKFMDKNIHELKYQKRKEYINSNNEQTYSKLSKLFVENISNSNPPNTEKDLILKKIKKWNEIKDFLQFIYNEMPKHDILCNTETDFYKNRFQLWKFYLEKINKKQ